MTATTSAAFLQCKRRCDSRLGAQLQEAEPVEKRQVPAPVEPQPQELQLEGEAPQAHGTVTVMMTASGSTPVERHRVGGTSGSTPRQAEAQAVTPAHHEHDVLPSAPQPKAQAAREVAPEVMVSPNRPPLPLSEPIKVHHEPDLCAALRLMLGKDAGLAGVAVQRHSWVAARTCTPTGGGLTSGCEGKLMFVQGLDARLPTGHVRPGPGRQAANRSCSSLPFSSCHTGPVSQGAY